MCLCFYANECTDDDDDDDDGDSEHTHSVITEQMRVGQRNGSKCMCPPGVLHDV